MKKSVIFWNIIGAIFYMFLLTFGYGVISFFTLVFSTIIGLALVIMNLERGMSPLDIKSLQKNGFIFWFLYITPAFLLSIIIHFIYKCVTKFNNWLNK